MSDQNPNSKVFQKGTVTTSALTSGGGKLKDTQAQRFIDYVVNESMMQKLGVRVVKIKPEQHDIPKVSVGGRAVYPASEGSDPGFRRSVTTSKITIRHDKVIIPWSVTEDTIWFNVEQERFNDHIMRMLSDTARNNFEEMCWSSVSEGHAIVEDQIKDGGSSSNYVKDGFLAFSDGWLEEAYSGHPVNLGYNYLSLSMFSEMIKNMPTKYIRDRSQFAFITSPDIEQDLRMTVAARATTKGDQAVFGGNDVLTLFGIPVYGVPLFPETPKVTEHLTFPGGGANVVTTRYPNIANVVVTPSALASSATAAYVNATDYSYVASTGVITNLGAAIGATATVKVTYTTQPQVLLTRPDNLIFVMSEDLRLKTDYNIYEDSFLFAMHARVGCKVQETGMCVLGYNIRPLAL